MDGAIEIDGVKRPYHYIAIEPDYLDLFDIKLVKGRNYSWDRKAERHPGYPVKCNYSVLLNETAVREWLRIFITDLFIIKLNHFNWFGHAL